MSALSQHQSRYSRTCAFRPRIFALCATDFRCSAFLCTCSWISWSMIGGVLPMASAKYLGVSVRMNGIGSSRREPYLRRSIAVLLALRIDQFKWLVHGSDLLFPPWSTFGEDFSTRNLLSR